MVQSGQDGETRPIAEVHRRDQPANFVRKNHPAIYSEDLVVFGAHPQPVHRGVRMPQRQVAALAEQHVPSQLTRQLLVELYGGLVKGNAFGCAIVRPNDGSITPAVAASQVALFEQRHPADAVP